MFEFRGELAPRFTRGQHIVVASARNAVHWSNDDKCDVFDAVSGQCVASTAQSAFVDSSGALVWRSSPGGALASGSIVGDGVGRELAFTGSKTLEHWPFCVFHFGVLIVDLGRGRFRVLRFDASVDGVADRAESACKVLFAWLFRVCSFDLAVCVAVCVPCRSKRWCNEVG